MSLKLYNSLTNKIEEFKPIENNKVTMYVCGPTVYNYIHIGNARPVVFYDMVRRYLEFCGYEVTYASNITDIDDKIINKAIAENKTEKEIASFYEHAYFEDCAKVGSRKPNLIPHATEYINDMLELIDELVSKGYAYNIDGNVYFRINKLNDYGILSNQSLEDLTEGARVDVDNNKENPLDFTLWKKTENGIKWDSKYGLGRPGWHTECVCMNHKNFGNTIDIHGGGMDLKFPHHENEIAQSKALYNSNLANYWVHVGRVDLSGQKMSKSLGNVIFVKDLKDNKAAMVLRMVLLFSPYRSIINYSEELQKQYETIYDKWLRSVKQTKYFLEAHDYKNVLDDQLIDRFKEAMDNDFNVQNVLTLLEEIIKNINTSYRSKQYDDLNKYLSTFLTLTQVLGIDFYLSELDESLKETYLKWENARNNKDFENADKYRNILVESNIL